MNGSQMVSAARLREAIAGRRCVSAWLGYGDVLFLGLGNDVIRDRGDDGQRVRPPFELETNFADWLVEGPMTAGTADSNRAQLECAAESLVGEHVMGWDLLERNGLRLAFAGAKVLTVVPWNPADGISNAWSVTSPRWSHSRRGDGWSGCRRRCSASG